MSDHAEAAHDASHDAEHVKKHVKVYLVVFGALLVLTGITVGVSYMHLDTVPAILVALFVASIKGSLVASYFMHLIDEKKVIYWTIALCALFFAVILMLPTLTSSSNQHPATWQISHEKALPHHGAGHEAAGHEGAAGGHEAAAGEEKHEAAAEEKHEAKGEPEKAAEPAAPAAEENK